MNEKKRMVMGTRAYKLIKRPIIQAMLLKKKNGFVKDNVLGGLVWYQTPGNEYQNYIHISFATDGSVRHIELSFVNKVQCSIDHTITEVAELNQLLRLFNIDKIIEP